jgi:hypothetical protein
VRKPLNHLTPLIARENFITLICVHSSGRETKFHTHLNLTSFMGHSPSKVYIRPARQEIPRHISNPKVHYRVHVSPPMIPPLSQTNPFNPLISLFFKIRFNNILPC